jgi:hypothetical protein
MEPSTATAINPDDLDPMEINRAMLLVRAELASATRKFPPFRSAHEGYAILLEEVDELWETIKDNKDEDAIWRQRDEAIQVAAMAVRFLLDLGPDGGRDR